MSDNIFKPLNSNVLVSIVEKVETEGGVLLPPTVMNHGIVTGVILDIGDSVLDVYGNAIPVNVEIGDTVYFVRTQAIEVIPNSNKYLVGYKSLIGKAV